MSLPEDQFQLEIDYAAAVLLSREILQTGIIDDHDFAQINRLYIDRFDPVFRQKSSLK